MKKVDTVSDIFILSAIGFLLILFSSFLIACQGDETESVDHLIKVAWLNPKTIQVAFGYDAITAISTKGGIVVIDSGISFSLAKKYRRIIEKEFGQNNFLFLINTHAHQDHTGGNGSFSDAVIIGHENCKEDISEQWKNLSKVKANFLEIADEYGRKLNSLNVNSDEWEENYIQKFRYKFAADDIIKQPKLFFPLKTFSDQMNLTLDDLSMNLIYFGTAHSQSDIIIHVPKLKMLFTGDLFSRYGRPHFDFNEMKKNERWNYVKEWLLKRVDEIDKIVTGHGKILSRDDLESFIQFNNAIK